MEINGFLESAIHSHANLILPMFRTHTMLGPNPRKAITPSTAYAPPMSSGSDSSSTGDGLMVKAIDDIFNYVETAENPQEFRVSYKVKVLQPPVSLKASLKLPR